MNQERSTGWWTDEEIELFLDSVSTNCTLMTARGLSLKKTAFNQAHVVVKTKDAAQCHYKWGNVCTIIIHDGFIAYLSYPLYSYVAHTERSGHGTQNWVVAGMTIMVPMHKPQVRKPCSRNF